jgi:hypothetical protein
VPAQPLLPPSRQLAHSDALLCVVAGCQTRAVVKVEVRIGGQVRDIDVCRRHAGPHMAR